MTNTSREQRLAPPAGTPPTATLTWAAFVVVLLAYFPGWMRFPIVWLENRSYGFLAAGLCLWLLSKERHRITYEAEVVNAGVPFWGAVASLAWLAAMALEVQVLQLALLPLVLLLWTGGVFGRAALRITAPIAMIFLLAVPLWEVFAGVLQGMTASANSLLVRATSIRAVVEGNYIRFPFGTIEVAESCSGLSYFMTALTVSTAYGQIVLHEWRARCAALVLAASLAIVANWARVFGLVVIGFYSRMQSPLMAEHGTYGWLVFCAALVGFFLCARRMERFDAYLVRRRHVASEDIGVYVGTDEAINSKSRTRRLAFATSSALVGPLLFWVVGTIPAQRAVDPAMEGVNIGAAWTQESSGQSRASWSPAFRGASETRTLNFVRGGQGIQVDRFIYAHPSQRTELISSLNAIAPAKDMISERLAGPLDEGMRLVRQAVIRTPDGPRLVWYWYRVSGVVTSDPTKAKLLELVTFFRRGPPSELIAVSALCQSDGCASAMSALLHFVTGREENSLGAP